jgi:predicted alpha-1,2-mannosidase
VAPYYYTGKKIQGFRGSHWLGGSCSQDYGSFTIMPMTGYLRTFANERASSFDHENEISTPAYYSCMLQTFTTFVEMTGTARAGFFRFSYLKKSKAIILVTPNSDQGKGYLKIDPENQEIYGYNPVCRLDKDPGRSAGFSGYFVVRFNKAFTSYGCSFQMEDHKKQTEISGQPDIGAYAAFDIQGDEVIMAKAGTSFTSIEAARANLEAEIPHWNFEKTKAETERLWNQTLSAVQLKGGKTQDYTTFYTALYHSMLFPRTFSDVDGTYPAFEGNKTVLKMEKGHVYYDDFLLSDTHCAQLPLVSLLAPDKYEDMMTSLVLKAEQSGWLPAQSLRNTFADGSDGDPANKTLGDACLKGFNINIEKAYPLMRKNAFEIPQAEDFKMGKGRRALKAYLEKGDVSSQDTVNEGIQNNRKVSLGVEYAMTDFVLSRVAERYGKAEDAAILAKRAKEYLSPEIGLQNLWLVSNTLPRSFDMGGGKEKVRSRLDEFFSAGEYWQSNELTLNAPYLYNFVGDGPETQKKVKNILSTEYTNYDGGIPGNDHAGQTSAWYVFSAMGFYPVSPGSGEYQLSSPIFSQVELNLDPKYYPGKRFTITADHPDSFNTYSTVELNNKKNAFVLKHEDLRSGGELRFSNP